MKLVRSSELGVRSKNLKSEALVLLFVSELRTHYSELFLLEKQHANTQNWPLSD
jgi:hypothetical protein